MPPPTKTSSIAMNTSSFCCFVGPRDRTTIVGVRGRRGAGIGTVRTTSGPGVDCGAAVAWNGCGVNGRDGVNGVIGAIGVGGRASADAGRAAGCAPDEPGPPKGGAAPSGTVIF